MLCILGIFAGSIILILILRLIAGPHYSDFIEEAGRGEKPTTPKPIF